MTGLCGCCEPAAPVTPLALYNRPGLSSVAYRIGTYASFREAMLEAIAHTPELAGLGSRRDDDAAITLLDLWAAVSDVLTFYQERYANEVFLRTAQQPQSLRRLAGLLGYNPRPGVAALADLAFSADLAKIVQVPLGLRVQSLPAQDQLPQTFETLQPATVDARFNRLRIYPQPVPLNQLQHGRTESILSRQLGPRLGASLAPNDQVVIFNDSGSVAVEEKKVKQTRVEDDRVIVGWTQPVQAPTWNNASIASKFRRRLHLFGYNLPDTWFHPVPTLGAPGGILWKSDPIIFNLPSSSGFDLDSRYSDLAAGTRLLFVTRLSGGGLSTIARSVTGVTEIPAKSLGPLADTVSRVTLDGAIPACPDRRFTSIYELTGDRLLFADTSYDVGINSGTVYLPGVLRKDDGGIGVEVGLVVQQDHFAPGVVIHPKDLEVGRKCILMDAQNHPFAATLHSPPVVDPPGASVGTFVHLVLTLDADSVSLQTASAVLLGNIIPASHGETVRSEVIGSGDGSQTFQRFALQKQPLTCVPGSGSNGVVGSLSVRVNGLLWREVPGLYQQPMNAQVYSTSFSEDGKAILQFGDANVGGAILPSGPGNVTATYRYGAGLAGRAAANALTTLLDRLQGLNGVTNPLAAEGGADPEVLEMIRLNAPRTVRTFGRAVSLQDFEDLMTASGEVAKAEGVWIWDGRSSAVYLTIAGQAGGTFSDPAALTSNLDARDPNRRVLVGNFVRVPVLLFATVIVSPQYVQDDVVKAVRATLLQALSFDTLRLGQSLHLSAMYSVMQAVPGIVALDINKFGFLQPDGMSGADFKLYLDSRGVERHPDGSVAEVQEHLRIFSARPNTAVTGGVFPAELASVETPGQDIFITVQGS